MRSGIEAGVIKEIESIGSYTVTVRVCVSLGPRICTRQNSVNLGFFSHMAE